MTTIIKNAMTRRSSLFRRCVLLLIVSFSISASYAQSVNLILAADMPDVSDPTSGHYAELKSVLDTNREQASPVFFVFGGGSIGPSAMSVFDRGAHIVDILNTLEPDVMTVTKREFSYSEDELSLRAYEAAFPIVTSNVKDKRFDSTPAGLVETTIIEKQGIKLGIVSILNERVIEEYLLTHLVVDAPRQAAELMAAQLRQQGADIVLLHHSYPFEFVHNLLESGIVDIAFMSDSRIKDFFEQTVTHPNKLILGEPGIALRVSLQLQNNRVSVVNNTRIALSSVAADTAVQLQVDSYQLRLNRLLNERIGTWQSDMSTERFQVRTNENRFANFIASTMRDYAQSDIAIINGGSIRGDTNYSARSPITRRHIATELPFRSKLVRIQVSGEQLTQALENGLSEIEYVKGGFPHVAGIKVVYDATLPSGSRVKSITIDNKLVRSDAIYTLATTDYLARGGDGYESLVGSVDDDPQQSGTILIADLVVQNIRIQGGVDSELDLRMENVGQNK